MDFGECMISWLTAQAICNNEPFMLHNMHPGSNEPKASVKLPISGINIRGIRDWLYDNEQCLPVQMFAMLDRSKPVPFPRIIDTIDYLRFQFESESAAIYFHLAWYMPG